MMIVVMLRGDSIPRCYLMFLDEVREALFKKLLHKSTTFSMLQNSSLVNGLLRTNSPTITKCSRRFRYYQHKATPTDQRGITNCETKWLGCNKIMSTRLMPYTNIENGEKPRASSMRSYQLVSLHLHSLGFLTNDILSILCHTFNFSGISISNLLSKLLVYL